MPGLMTRLSGVFTRHKKRVARLFLLIGGLFFAARLAPHIPTTTDIVLRLGPDHAHVVGLDLSYEQGGSEIRHADYRYPGGAPREVRLAVRLPAGDHALQARLVHRDGHTDVRTRSFSTPTQGELRLDLGE